jgi:hypothetical protein
MPTVSRPSKISIQLPNVGTDTEGVIANGANAAVTVHAAVMGAVIKVPGDVVVPPQPLTPVST